MQVYDNFPLSEMTSFKTGGIAEKLVRVDSSDELYEVLNSKKFKSPKWFLGFGTNTLISDKGLLGTTVIIKGGTIKVDKQNIVADAGVWWDKVVEKAIARNLWGIELMSGIPGGVGAAVVGNIAAYGQAVSDTLISVEVLDRKNLSKLKKQIKAEKLGFDYRNSKFQDDEFKDLIITKATFGLSRKITTKLEYNSALKVADELGINPKGLKNRREIILESRRRAGSLAGADSFHTAGSFFKNPLVSSRQLDQLLEHDEWGLSKKNIKKQQKIHGGSESRVSASLVLLAAGFNRGQKWGEVRLHPDHVLKIENMGKATSQDIYNVVQEITTTVNNKLKISLEPEVRFIGKF